MVLQIEEVQNGHIHRILSIEVFSTRKSLLIDITQKSETIKYRPQPETMPGIIYMTIIQELKCEIHNTILSLELLQYNLGLFPFPITYDIKEKVQYETLSQIQTHKHVAQYKEHKK